MKRIISSILTLIMLATVVCGISSCGKNSKNTYKGSLELELNANGSYSSVKSKGKEIITESGKGGFFIYDFDTKSYYPITASSVTKKGNVVTFNGGNTELNVSLTATLESKNGSVTFRGTVKDLTGNDRRFRVEHSLPIDAEGWRFGINLNESEKIQGKEQFINHYTVLSKIYQANYPYGCVSNDEIGIAASTLFESPVVYDFYYDNETKLFTQAFYMGLSSLTKNPSEGSFSFVLYDFEGYYGSRGAADGMYKLIPEAFETKAEDHGNWLFQQNAYYNLPGVLDYLAVFNETPNYISDELYGVASAKYVAPAEIWISWYDYSGPNAVPTASELLSKLENMLTMPETAKDMYDNVSQKDIATAIFSSGYYINKNNEYWNAGWNSSYNQIMCFIANGNPNIPAPSNYSIHRQIYNDEEAKAASEGYKVTALYIDNANFGAVTNLDYNTANYKYSSYPLLWSNSGTLALPLGYSTWEFIDAFTAEESDKISLGNIAFPDNGSATALAHFFDIPGGEIGNSWGQTDEEFMFRRVNAYQKPWALLLTQAFNDVFEGVVDKTQANYYGKELLMKRALFWGVMCNPMTLTADTTALESVRPLMVKYGTAQKLVSEAGWEPITHAVPTSSAISCERYGGGSGEAVWFTVRANKDNAENEGIYVPLPNLGFKKSEYNKLVAFDIIANKVLDVTVDGDIMTVKSDLSKEEDVAAVIIGTPAQIAKALEKDNNAAYDRIEAKVDELIKLAPKKLSDSAEAVATLKEIKKANNEFKKAVNKADFASAAAALEKINELATPFVTNNTFGAVTTLNIKTEITSISERYFARYNAFSK